MKKTCYVFLVIVYFTVVFLFCSCTKVKSDANSELSTTSNNIEDNANYYDLRNPITFVVKTNDGSKLNIREYPIEGKIIAQITDGTTINATRRTKDKYTIDQLSDYWYYTASEIDGVKTDGWLFGGYLSEMSEKNGTSNQYTELDLSDNNYIIAEQNFKTEFDKNAWKKLAGYYFIENERQTIGVIDEINTPWGKDYSFGIGCHSISYQNGKWCHGGDGEALFYTLDSVSNDGKSFNMTSDYGRNEVWRIDGEYLYLDSKRYYKFTGPDCYKRFIRKFVDHYNESIIQYNTGSNNYDEVLSDITYQILEDLNNGNYKSISKFINTNTSLTLVIGDYQGKSIFTYDELNTGSEEVVYAFDFIKSDLNTHDKLLSIKPVYNKFIHLTMERFKEKYPDSDVLVEYTLSEYEELSFIFKEINGKLMLTTVIDYAVFRA